jgi:acetyl-CoA C-acetyltransferase
MSAAHDPVVIVSFARTPMGGFQGALGGVKATELGATAVKAAIERAGVSGDLVEQIIMGCVLPAGLGQAPARQAAIGAGLPQVGRGHHGQQDVRQRHAGRDHGP